MTCGPCIIRVYLRGNKSSIKTTAEPVLYARGVGLQWESYNYRFGAADDVLMCENTVFT